MINEVHDAAADNNSSVETARKLTDELTAYAAVHFAHEEEYMEAHNDPELARQRTEHRIFTDMIGSINIDSDDEQECRRLVNELLEFLARWLYHHILGSDIMIGRIESADDNLFAFTDKYITGIDIVDEEHKKLFEIIAETNNIIHAEHLYDKYDEIVEILGELKDYTEKHFADEESYMASIEYSGLDAQKRAHEAFVEKLSEIDLDEVDNNQEQYLNDLIDYLLSWLINHILKVDKLIPVK